MAVLALIGIKVALNTITPTVSLMTDYSVLNNREIKHLKVWTHKTNLPPPPLPFSSLLFLLKCLQQPRKVSGHRVFVCKV